MSSIGLALLWLWIIVLDWCVCLVSLPEITNQRFIDECVKEHNRARSNVNPPASNMLYMTWDEALAVTARAWARFCVFEHNSHLKDARSMHPTFTSVGENIWTAYPPSAFDTAVAIRSWVNETNVYNYSQNICTGICGHYTQVVWADSYKVGCAVQLCPNGVHLFTQKEGVVFVCNYAPAGNRGMRPYMSGAACSGCKGSCVEKLCRNQEQDAQKDYNWTPAWDPESSDKEYLSILIARPIGLIFTFITAFIVHYFYTDVFCYE
ncbi:GLIPR1-like protein 1 [Pholidichthys leucotaenia]